MFPAEFAAGLRNPGAAKKTKALAKTKGAPKKKSLPSDKAALMAKARAGRKSMRTTTSVQRKLSQKQGPVVDDE